MPAQSFEIRLLGQKIALKTSQMDPEILDEVVSLVSEKLKDAEKQHPRTVAPHQIMLLALLDLAEEYVRARQSTLDYKHDLNEKCDVLLKLIEEELK